MAAAIVLPESDRARLLAFARAHGHKRAAELLEINLWTLTRALAACGVRRGTAALIRMKLTEMTRAA